MDYDDFDRKCGEFNRRKPKERIIRVIEAYYDHMRYCRMRELPEEKRNSAESMDKRFNGWLYDPADITLKIEAVEEYFFEVAPDDPPIQKDLLERLDKLNGIFAELYEKGGTEENSRRRLLRRKRK